jgi:hypothetical protein
LIKALLKTFFLKPVTHKQQADCHSGMAIP